MIRPSAPTIFDFGVGWHVPEYSKGVMEYDSPHGRILEKHEALIVKSEQQTAAIAAAFAKMLASNQQLSADVTQSRSKQMINETIYCASGTIHGNGITTTFSQGGFVTHTG